MKKFAILVGLGFLGWFLMTNALIGSGTTTLSDKIQSTPALVNLDTLSTLVVLDSLRKTGMLTRYKYTQNEFQELLRDNGVQLKDQYFDYTYCWEGDVSKHPRSNMIVIASQKNGSLILGKGTPFLEERIPALHTLESFPVSQKKIQEKLDIKSDFGNCIAVQ